MEFLFEQYSDDIGYQILSISIIIIFFAIQIFIENKSKKKNNTLPQTKKIKKQNNKMKSVNYWDNIWDNIDKPN